MNRLRVKNWEQFQHYKDRSPPWIKLHKSLLDDYQFHCLPVASRALAPCIWLLASESDDGSVAHDPETISFRLRMSIKDVEAALLPLVSAGFLIELQDASAVLADSKQDASAVLSLARSREERREEAEKSTSNALSLNGAFAQFWGKYPKKKSKGHAERAWSKLKPDGALQEKILQALERASASVEWGKDSGQFIPHPATWLNAKGWEDEQTQPVKEAFHL